VTPKAIVTRTDWLFELVSAGAGVGVTAHHADLPHALIGRPVEGTAVAQDVHLITKRGRLYSPPVKAFVDLALKPRPRSRPVATAA
jgi:DNA-binding transcriptional LysR family regulator